MPEIGLNCPFLGVTGGPSFYNKIYIDIEPSSFHDLRRVNGFLVFTKLMFSITL
jgi:hypothetical protein